mmetsp:Transcript_99645/g.237554  ORF Transcript_99645/g.237554 Transcript_99645/m.237554 type:complete len:218 (-) Transcript_99645:418-1071(-)
MVVLVLATQHIGERLVGAHPRAGSLGKGIHDHLIDGARSREVGCACVDNQILGLHVLLVLYQRTVPYPEVYELKGPVVRLRHRKHHDVPIVEVLVHASPQQGTGLRTVGVQEKGELVPLQQLLLDDTLKERLDAPEGQRGESQAQDAFEGKGGEHLSAHLPDHRKGLLLHFHGAHPVGVHVQGPFQLPGAEHNVDVMRPFPLVLLRGHRALGIVEAP